MVKASCHAQADRRRSWRRLPRSSVLLRFEVHIDRGHPLTTTTVVDARDAVASEVAAGAADTPSDTPCEVTAGKAAPDAAAAATARPPAVTTEEDVTAVQGRPGSGDAGSSAGRSASGRA